MPDQTFTCKDCNQPFVHDEKEQAFFQTMGYNNPPKRCVICRKRRRRETEEREGARFGQGWDDKETK